MSTEDTPKPVAWMARGYSQFRTGEPSQWRYFDGPAKPMLNLPNECDIEPLYNQATIDAAVAKERERCAAWLECEGRHDMSYGIRHIMHCGPNASLSGGRRPSA